MSDNSTEDSGLAKFGLIASAIYVVVLFVGVPTAFYFGWLKWSTLGLNELGDFLAGAFGPLAIFWLVLGFFQQSRELRNSVDALKLQSEELAASTEQQTVLARTNQEIASNEQERWRFNFELERRKLVAEIKQSLAVLEDLMPKARDSRHALSHALQGKESGAKRAFDEKYEKWGHLVSEIQKKFGTINPDCAIDYSESTAMFLAELYEHRLRLFGLVEELKSELEEDRFRRAQNIQAQSRIAGPPTLPYGSGRPPNR